ncbi:hypothetical protein HMPREF1587_02075 [Bifidobacterium breve JCP7499]|nr:hypothetical protein HMPREF1587_02075 [Bifidobacterium breve JCP7499]
MHLGVSDLRKTDTAILQKRYEILSSSDNQTGPKEAGTTLPVRVSGIVHHCISSIL